MVLPEWRQAGTINDGFFIHKNYLTAIQTTFFSFRSDHLFCNKKPTPLFKNICDKWWSQIHSLLDNCLLYGKVRQFVIIEPISLGVAVKSETIYLLTYE